MSPVSIFDTCQPRKDVLSGTTRDEQFAANLSDVVNGGAAAAEYADPAVFFAHTYPTRGMKVLLKAVCQRLSGKGGEVASIIRLHTQYGGGKTHGLIALVHAVRGMKGVANTEEFVPPDLLPQGKIRVAALDGENSDPANGLALGEGLRAHSLWGEMAWQLAGREGFERIAESDRRHVAPGAETIRELFGGEPTLIMMDEVSVYLRKVERAFPGASDQFAAFIHALVKAVATSPNVALVVTLAVGKNQESKDAYKVEQQRALAAFAEAEGVASRSATQLNPTEEDETVEVLRRRLFDHVDLDAAKQVASAYADIWKSNHDSLIDQATQPETRRRFLDTYPLHPELMDLLTEKTATLSTFQRTRGMLRLLARTVHTLWRDRPDDALAIHSHHVNLSFSPIREEITVRLGQGDYTPALKADVEALSGEDRALAQRLDQQHNPGQLPASLYTARTIFLHTLAYGDELRGITPDRLRFSICSPVLEPSFVEQSRVRFVEESLYLDDRPGAPMRFMVEPNLTQMIRRQMQEIDAAAVRDDLNARIRRLFSPSKAPFALIAFPAGPYDVPDEIGDGRPILALLGYDAVKVFADPTAPPPELEDMFLYKGSENQLREYRNNLVFVVADERLAENMKTHVRRRLALAELLKPENVRELADYQQTKVKSEYAQMDHTIAESILHCYRHLFYPSHIPLPGSKGLAHTAIEVSNASDSPGNGQLHIVRILREQKKTLGEGDPPDAPNFVRDQTPLKTKGSLTTLELRSEFRRAPKLSILLDDGPLLRCIREGIDGDTFIYREDSQVWGKGDPAPAVKIAESAFVHTMPDAREKKLWPRVAALQVIFKATPETIDPGDKAVLTLGISGGVPPYRIESNVERLSVTETDATHMTASVHPEGPTTYQVTVTDSRGESRNDETVVLIKGIVTPPPPPNPVVKPKVVPPPGRTPQFTAEGPLAQALTQLWEQTRKAKAARIASLLIRFFDAQATWKVHNAIASIREAETECKMEAEIRGQGVKNLALEFEGASTSAKDLKPVLDRYIQGADESTFQASFDMKFAQPVPTDGDHLEKLSKAIVRYGAGEAYVEARAARLEETPSETEPAP